MKKRYMLTLDQELVTKFKKSLKEMGLPSNTFSAIVNDMLEGTYPVYKQLADNKMKGHQSTIDDLLVGVSDSFKKLLEE